MYFAHGLALCYCSHYASLSRIGLHMCIYGNVSHSSTRSINRRLRVTMVISIAVNTLSGEVANIRCSRGTSMHGLKQMLKAHLMIPKHKQRLFAGEVEWTDEGISVGQFLRGKARIMIVILSAKPCLVCTQEACRLCERCCWAFYCATSCQAQDWKNHNKVCIGANVKQSRICLENGAIQC